MMNKRQISIALVACKKIKLVSGRERDLSICLILAYYVLDIYLSSNINF